MAGAIDQIMDDAAALTLVNAPNIVLFAPGVHGLDPNVVTDGLALAAFALLLGACSSPAPGMRAAPASTAQAQVADSGGEQRRDEAFVLDEAFEGHGAHPARLGDAAVSVRVAEAFGQFTTREAGHHRVGVAEALAPRVCRSGDGRRAPARAQ